MVKERILLRFLCAASLLALAAGRALANPSGGTVVAGSAAIASSGNKLTVDQNTKIVIVDWSQFNIGKGETTQFLQPSPSALAVNRIGDTSPAQILGNLLANGRVVLIDGNGILFGPNAKVNVGSLIATTSDASNEAILSGKADFNQPGNPNAAIINQGRISAAKGGLVGLIAPSVSNSGVISARLGTVQLAGANVFTVDFTGDGLISFPVDPSVLAAAITANGQPVKALVANSGRIEGASVIMTARVAANLVENAISMGGEVAATAVHDEGGKIVLDGGEGAIALNGATLDAGGKNGGGTITVGSWNASAVAADATTNLNASATGSGSGGSIAVIAKTTAFHGTAKAEGGARAGNGGRVETSGNLLDVSGAKVSTLAPHGATGTWTLDPYDVTISTGTTTNQTASGSPTSSYTASGNDSVLNVNDLETALAGSNVSVTTGGLGSAGSQSGDITVAAPLTWSANTLTLQAYHSIFINVPVSATGTAGLVLTTNNGGTGGDYLFGSSGNVTFAGTSQPLTINGNAYTLVNSVSSLASAISSNSSGNYALANAYNAGGDGTYTASPVNSNFTGTFAGLGNTISNLSVASGSVNIGLFAQIGSGGVVRDLGLVNVSLLGSVSAGGLTPENLGTVSNSYVTGRVVGGSNTGGLVADNPGTVTNSYSTAEVDGDAGTTGGLVGLNFGTVSNSYATGAVSFGGEAGGLVGFNQGGTITNSYATGTVNGEGGGGAGGLVGDNSGTVSFSHATGGVSGSEDDGGLTGINEGSVSFSYATGQVFGFGNSQEIGGLVGSNIGGAISNSYATGAADGSGIQPAVGGLVGLSINAGANVTNSYSTGAVGEVGINPGGFLGGFIGINFGGSSNNYFDSQTAGLSNSVAGSTLTAGITGVTTAQLSSAPVLAALNSGGANWGNVGNLATPYLLTNQGPVNLASDGSSTPTAYSLIFNTTELQAVNGNLSANYALTQSLDGSSVTNWSPIGESTAFTGTFEGLGNTISNLTINDTSDSHVGLFGQIGAGGVVRNVGLIGGTVTGGAGATIGALAGSNAGTVNNAYATASVIGGSGAFAGGLVGNNSGTLSVVYATGAVGGGGATLGGLVGINGGTVSNSYATGTTGGSGATAGGLVGENDATVSDTYATGAVSGAVVGGLVGNNASVVSGSYAIGAVTGTTLGGLAGENSGTVTDGYFDSVTAGTSTGVGSGSASGVTAETTAGLASAMVLTGLNSGGVAWNNNDNQTTAYLLANPGPVYSGTDASPTPTTLTLILNMTELQAIDANLSGNYALSHNLDASPVTGWTPIGETTPFTGTLDGLGNSISNLTINDTTHANVGLFGQIGAGGTVRNLALIGGSVTGSAGGAKVGALAGSNAGTVSNSYATATVSGTTRAGGLVGLNNGGMIANSYAMGAVSGGANADVGGLVGNNNGGTISNSYAIGAVSGGSSATVGGLAGGNSGTVANGYFDSQTAGTTTDGGGATALTTAQLQGALPSGFDSTVWGTGTGLFPYFLSQYPTTPQAITGTAYASSGSVLAVGSVSAQVAGTSLGTVSTGANGYYYVLAPAATISGSGSAVIATVGSGTGARVDSLTAPVANFDVWDGTLIAPTTATTYSAASGSSLQSQDAGLIAGAVGGNSALATSISGISNYGYIATGAGFALDQPLTLTNGLYVKSAAGGITVAAALTLPGTVTLELDSYQGIAFNAPVTVTGAGSVTLVTNDGGSGGDYLFAAGANIAFTGVVGSNTQGSLSINGASFTLVNSVNQLASAVSNNSSDDYAMANSYDASGDGTYTASPVSTSFTGTFEGLGNTISNLTINDTSDSHVGLFAQVGASGTVRGIGLANASVTGGAGAAIGALAGSNAGTVSNVYTTGAASGGNGATVGALVGNNTGTVTSAYVTAIVSGGSSAVIGGLVGANGGTVSNAYAAVAVSGGSGSFAGGLIGNNTGTLTSAYAIGAVTGAAIGGLAGENSGTVTNGYFDSEMAGTSAGAGTARTTAQLQGALPSGFDSTVWGTGSGLFPYLLWQYPSGTPQAIAGIAYISGGSSVLAGGSVTTLVAGTGLGTVSTGANGYYYVTASAGTISGGGSAVVAAVGSGSGARVDSLTAPVANFDVWDGTLIAPTSATSYSTASATTLQSQNASLISGAVGSNVALATAISSIGNYGYLATGGAFTLDQPLILANGFYLKNTGGGITAAAALTLPGAARLLLDSQQGIAFNAPVTVTGAGSVTLVTNDGGSGGDYLFAAGANIAFADVVGGTTQGNLTVNGAGFTLVNSVSQLGSDISSNASGNYALAESYDASGDGTYTASPVSTSFTGTFDGLGNTISNLTINDTTHADVGLFAQIGSGGTVRDVGLIGGSVSGGAGADVGGLAGLNGGTVNYSYSGAAVGGGTNSNAGGLVGQNGSGGAVSNSYALGAVSGSINATVGGLVGENDGTVSNAYATGAVSGGSGAFAGGLVGNNTGTVTGAYAIGQVTGVTAGGLVGENTGTVTNGYFDSVTAGTSADGGGATAQTTAQLQGAPPSGFDSTIWGTGSGLFPYLLSRYPSTPQAIAGIVYASGGGSVLAADTVTTLVAGNNLGTVSTGDNGYYYELAPSGTISGSGTAVVAYIGSGSGARIESLTGSASKFDLWDATLIAATSATTYSAASATPLQSQDAGLIAGAVGSNAAVASAVAGITHYGYVATSFTFDQPLTLANNFYLHTSQGNITIGAALTVQGSATLDLDSHQGIAFDAPVTVTGAGSVTLVTNDGGSGGDYTFALGAGMDFTDVVSGVTQGSLTINGAGFTLVNSVSQLADAISNNSSGDYALANGYDAGSDGTYTASPVSSSFTGTLAGLGNTISNLTINDASDSDVGLFAQIGSGGTVRDVGLVSGAVSGGFGAAIGALVAFNGGTVKNSYATGAVIGSASFAIGGLVGVNFGNNAIITASYASGPVTDSSGNFAGGLVGDNGFGGRVSNSFATGAVDGKFAGGLIGENINNASVIDSYATGAVSGSHVGGLIGSNSSGNAFLVFFDSETAGTSNRVTGGVAVFTTAQLQGTLPAGFSASIWGTGTGLFPYLLWQYPSGTPQAISGIAYSDAGVTPLASGGSGAVTVSLLVNGATTAGATTGANGYYYILQPPGSFNGANQVLTYLSGGPVQANTYVSPPSGTTTGADLYGGYLRIVSGAATVSSMLGGVNTATGGNTGSDFLYAGGSLASNTSVDIESSRGAGLSVDTALDAGTGTIILDAAGPVTQSAALSAAKLELLGAGASYSLTGSNDVGALAANTGAVSFSNGGDLALGTVNDTAGITSSGAVTVAATGNITVAAGATVSAGSGDNVVLSASGGFVNDQGSGAVSVSGGGRWLIYSATSAGDIFGSLDSGNTAIWNATISSLPPASVTQSGNIYLFTQQPTLTFTTTSDNKTYGANAASAVAAAYSVSGLQPAVTGAYLDDSAASVYSGAPSVTSTGSAVTAGVSGGPYAVTAATGTLTALNGYAFSFASPGELTVDPATLTPTLTNSGVTKAYDGTANAPAGFTPTYSFSGFISGDTGASLTDTSLAYNSARVVGASGITVSGLSIIGIIGSNGSQASDYTLSTNSLSVAATITAASLSGSLTNSGVTKVYDGTTSAPVGFTPTYSFSGFISGDTGASLTDTSAAYNSAHVISAGRLTISGLSISGITGINASLASDYTVNNSANVAATITPASLSGSLTNSGVTKAYDGATSAPVGFTPTYSFRGLISGDTSASLTDTSAAYNSAHVISADLLTISGLSISGITGINASLASDYTVNNSANVAATITAASLSGSLTNSGVTKAYDGTTSAPVGFTPTYSFSGFISGDTGASLTDTSAAYNSAHVISAGRLTISGLSISGITGINASLASDYTVNNSANVAATITPASLSGSLTNSGVTKVYDGTTSAPVGFTPTYSFAGLVAGDSATVSISAAPVFNSAHVASATTITQGGLSLTSITGNGTDNSVLSDYTLASTTAVTGNGVASITPASLTPTLTNSGVTKAYDGTATAPAGFMPTYSLSGLISGDTGASLADTSAAYNSAHVAAATDLTISGLSIGGIIGGNGSLASDYTLGINTVSVAATITTAPLTAILTNSGVAKTYNGTANPPAGFTPAYSFSGLVVGDTAASLTDTGAAYNSAHVANATVLTISGLSIGGIIGGNGSQTSDYTLAASSANVAATITPAPLTVSLSNATNITKTYDGAAAAPSGFSPTYSFAGLVGGDSATVSTSATPVFNSAHVTSATAIAQGGLSLTSITGNGTDNSVLSDYTLPGATAATGNGVAGITPATLTVTLANITDVTKTYDGTTAAKLTVSNYMLSGTVPGDTVSLNNPAAGSYDTIDAGTGKTVSVSGLTLSGASAADYALSSTTISGAIGTITQAPLTITASNQSKTYGQALSLGTAAFSTSGLFSPDTVTSVTLASSGAAATATVAASPYTITATSAVGSGLSNYIISYGSGALTVNPAILTASLTGTVTKTYDGTSAATLSAANYVLAGVLSGDTVNLSDPASGSYADRNAATGKTVSVSGLAISGASASNYALASIAISGAIGTISPATLFVVADDETSFAGRPDPVLAFSASGDVGGDNAAILSGSLGRAPGQTPGVYAIDLSTLSAGEDYTIAFTPADLTIALPPVGTGSAGYDNLLSFSFGAGHPATRSWFEGLFGGQTFWSALDSRLGCLISGSCGNGAQASTAADKTKTADAGAKKQSRLASNVRPTGGSAVAASASPASARLLAQMLALPLQQ